MDPLTLTISLSQIVMQLIAFGFALRIGFTMKATVWKLFSLAFFLMAMRRVTALCINLGWKGTSTFGDAFCVFDRTLLPFLISLIIVVSLFWLYKDIRSAKNI